MLTIERLKEVLHYDPETGVFTWLKTVGSHGPKGSVAGKDTQYGYRAVTLDGKRYLSHKLAWFYTYGTWPEKVVDHEDGNGMNNALRNLRDVSQSVNNRNRHRARSNSTTGLLGVYKGRRSSRYGAKIAISGKSVWLGTYDTAEEAHTVYMKAKQDRDSIDLEEVS